MTMATPARLGNKADAGRSKAQHVLILASCNKVEGITSSETVATDLTGRIVKETALISGIFGSSLFHNWPKGQCRVMIRILAAISVTCLLGACQAGTEYYGTGPLVLSEKAEGVLRQNIHGKNGIRENLVIAVDRRMRRFGGVYCPSSDIHSCIGGGSLSASQAVDNCNKDGKYDCWVYSIIDKIVWRGPVYVRDGKTQLNMPYHGIWSVTLDWPGMSTGNTTLVAMEGDLSVNGLSTGSCSVVLSSMSSHAGEIGIRCANGLTAGGDYADAGNSRIKGQGKDSGGRAFTFEIDFEAGQGLPAKPIT